MEATASFAYVPLFHISSCSRSPAAASAIPAHPVRAQLRLIDATSTSIGGESTIAFAYAVRSPAARPCSPAPQVDRADYCGPEEDDRNAEDAEGGHPRAAAKRRRR